LPFVKRSLGNLETLPIAIKRVCGQDFDALIVAVTDLSACWDYDEAIEVRAKGYIHHAPFVQLIHHGKGFGKFDYVAVADFRWYSFG